MRPSQPAGAPGITEGYSGGNEVLGGPAVGPRLRQGAEGCLEEGALLGLRPEGQVWDVMAQRRSWA